MAVALQISSIVISIAMIILILLQVKGGALGSLLGGDAGGGIARTSPGAREDAFSCHDFFVYCLSWDCTVLSCYHWLSLSSLNSTSSQAIKTQMSTFGQQNIGDPSHP